MEGERRIGRNGGDIERPWKGEIESKKEWRESGIEGGTWNRGHGREGRKWDGERTWNRGGVQGEVRGIHMT